MTYNVLIGTLSPTHSPPPPHQHPIFLQVRSLFLSVNQQCQSTVGKQTANTATWSGSYSVMQSTFLALAKCCSSLDTSGTANRLTFPSFSGCGAICWVCMRILLDLFETVGFQILAETGPKAVTILISTLSESKCYICTRLCDVFLYNVLSKAAVLFVIFYVLSVAL